MESEHGREACRCSVGEHLPLISPMALRIGARQGRSDVGEETAGDEEDDENCGA